MIRFDHVSKSYKGTPRPALDDITTEILRGEFVFVVGASGSGKSTFLRLILREERATRGKLHVLGQNLGNISNRKVPYFRRNVGVVFQDFRLLTNKTVFDNVAFTLQVIGKSKGFIHEAVPDVLAMVGLDGKAQRYPHELSGGEQQRVAIARAVVNKPQILLADEPTGNLDPATSAGITAVLERINAAGTTVLMATHEAGLVDRMQKRVIEIVNGRLVRDERHGGYGFTAAIPVLGDNAGAADASTIAASPLAPSPVGAGLAETESFAAAPVGASVPADRKPSRADRRAAKKAAKAASASPVVERPQPADARSSAAAPAAAEAPAAAQAHAEVPVGIAAAATLEAAHDEQSTRGNAQAAASAPPSPQQPARPPAPRPSELDEHFASPPTAPVRRVESSDVAELSLAERLGLRAPHKHDHDEDSNQDVGPVS